VAAVHLQHFLYSLPEGARQPFSDYLHANRGVWEAFEKYALEAATVREHYSAKSIIERVRWHCEITQRCEFKCNNNFTAYLARLFVAKYPQHGELFTFREVNGLQRAA
jgi:hypothetical protein